MSHKATHIKIVPDILTGNIIMIEGERVIGNLTSADAYLFANYVIRTADIAKELHEGYAAKSKKISA